MLPYDDTNPESIESYARKLLEKSLRDVLGSGIQQTYSGKGKLGQILEDLYFQYKPNSKSEPDFPKAGVELKTSPLKSTKKGLVSKERLVFNSINFNEEYKNDFETSAFWHKNKHLLLMFFFHEPEKIDLDYIFKIISLWKFPETDLKIIKDDWEKIIGKIKAGKAHELSEGDTLYLGACTKGKDSNSLRDQPFSTIKAMRRAFSLKSKYLNFVIASLFEAEKFRLKEFESVVKDVGQYKNDQTFEELIISRFEPFYGMSVEEMVLKLGIPKSTAKSRFYLIAKEILGVRKDKIEEFEKADLLLKTVRLEKSGALKESMSFAQIQFKEIVNEEWEESYWLETLTRRFFFVIFQKDENETLRLKKVFFWTMPVDDLEKAQTFWEDTKLKIINDDYEHFIKLSDNSICHVRPKGKDGKDLMETPSGRMEKKKCYWLNSSYIKKIIS